MSTLDKGARRLSSTVWVVLGGLLGGGLLAASLTHAELWWLSCCCLVAIVALHWLPSAILAVTGGELPLAGIAGLFAFGLECTRFLLVLLGAVLLQNRGIPTAVSVIALLPCTEALVPWPLPWQLGLAWVDQTWLAQSADIAGASTVTAQIACVNAALFELARRTTPVYSRLRRSAAYLVFPAFGVGYGALRAAEYPAESLRRDRSTTVAIVQPNIDPASTATVHGGRRAVERSLTLTAAMSLKGADLVVWPETAVPLAVSPREAEQAYRTLFSTKISAPLIFGAAFTLEPGENATRIFNAAVSMEVGGTITALYRKMNPVPIAESIPLGGARPDWLVEVVAGPAPVALRDGNVKLTPIICYDALLSDFVRDAVERTGGEAIVHLTNDAWYDETAKYLHLSTSRLRAIENSQPEHVIRGRSPACPVTETEGNKGAPSRSLTSDGGGSSPEFA